MPDTDEKERYVAAWSARRRRYRVYYGVLAAVAVVTATSGYWTADPLAVAGIGIVLMVCTTYWLYRFLCPRCGEIFWSQWLQKPRFLETGPQRCECCGLRVNEIPPAAFR